MGPSKGRQPLRPEDKALWLTSREVADLFGVSPRTARSWFQQRLLVARDGTHGAWRLFSRNSVLKLLKARGLHHVADGLILHRKGPIVVVTDQANLREAMDERTFKFADTMFDAGRLLKRLQPAGLVMDAAGITEQVLQACMHLHMEPIRPTIAVVCGAEQRERFEGLADFVLTAPTTPERLRSFAKLNARRR